MIGAIDEQISSFIADNFLFRENLDGLGPTDSLLELGIIDSTGVLELVGFLEETFGMTIADSDIVPENLDSIAAIAAFVGRAQDVRKSA